MAAALARQPAVPARADTLGHLLRGYSDQQPEATLAWIDAHLDPALRTDVLLVLGKAVSSDQPANTLPFALALPPSQERTRLLAHILTGWTETAPAAALAWARAQDDPAVAAALGPVQGALLVEIARSEPATALAEWQALSDPRARKAAMLPIAEAWGKNDPAAALKWLETQGASPAAGFIHPGLLSSWAKQDPESALRWVEAQAANPSAPAAPAGIERAMGALGGDNDGRFPRAATADLYSKIQDPALRGRVLETHVAEWLNKDPAAARAWIDSSDALSPEQAARLLAAKP